MRLLAVVFASGLVGVVPASAQVGVASCPVVRPAAVNGAAAQAFAPYSLVRTRTMVQTLVDGTQIRTRTESHEWRDAAGRQRTEIWVDHNGEMQLQNTTIYDPVLRENIARYPRAQAAQLVRMPAQVAFHPRPVDEAFSKAVQAARQPQDASHIEFKSERLGTAVIAGECVDGQRSTQTFAPGEIGNDVEIQVVSENWISPKLGMALKYTVDDPRTGHYVDEVTELDEETPDPAMFQVPPEYKVFDLTRDPAQP